MATHTTATEFQGFNMSNEKNIDIKTNSQNTNVIIYCIHYTHSTHSPAAPPAYV